MIGFVNNREDLKIEITSKIHNDFTVRINSNEIIRNVAWP